MARPSEADLIARLDYAIAAAAHAKAARAAGVWFWRVRAKLAKWQLRRAIRLYERHHPEVSR